MYRLTEKRLARAEGILEKYRAELFAKRSFSAESFERELRELWKVGYQQMKSIARDMLNKERYREVAAYYMEHSNPGTGVAAEFRLPLASLYGIRSYHAPEREQMRTKFWARVLGPIAE